MLIRNALAAATCALLVPAAASAATVKVDSSDGRIAYSAAPGEANNVTVSYKHVRVGHRYTIVDSGATVKPKGSRCKRATAHKAVCTSRFIRTKFALGDLDDRIEFRVPLPGHSVHVVFGGGGSDAITCNAQVTNARVGGVGTESYDQRCDMRQAGGPRGGR